MSAAATAAGVAGATAAAAAQRHQRPLRFPRQALQMGAIGVQVQCRASLLLLLLLLVVVQVALVQVHVHLLLLLAARRKSSAAAESQLLVLMLLLHHCAGLLRTAQVVQRAERAPKRLLLRSVTQLVHGSELRGVQLVRRLLLLRLVHALVVQCSRRVVNVLLRAPKLLVQVLRRPVDHLVLRTKRLLHHRLAVHWPLRWRWPVVHASLVRTIELKLLLLMLIL